jgi:hypothetical protein
MRFSNFLDIARYPKQKVRKNNIRGETISESLSWKRPETKLDKSGKIKYDAKNYVIYGWDTEL